MPAETQFVDASYVIALAQADDAYHDKAVALAGLAETAGVRFVTTQAVLLEVGAALAKVKARAGGIRLLTALQGSSVVEIMPLTEELVEQGWKLFCQRPDKEWSWTDCISFVAMSERGLTESLTSDQHFEQAGFTALLRH